MRDCFSILTKPRGALDSTMFDEDSLFKPTRTIPNLDKLDLPEDSDEHIVDYSYERRVYELKKRQNKAK